MRGLTATTHKLPRRTRRVVEGTVVTDQRLPVKGVADLLRPRRPRNVVHRRAPTATSGENGRFRIDLAGFPWAEGKIRASLLTPEFKLADRPVESVKSPATLDFEIVAQPWKQTLLSFVGESGQPVAGVEVAVSVGLAVWSRSQNRRKGPMPSFDGARNAVGITATAEAHAHIDIPRCYGG